MSLINPADSLERQNQKLLQIADVLMRRVEQKGDQAGIAYAQFERAALLEGQVRDRTQDLERALDLLQESNARLAEANRETEAARSNLADAIETIDEGFAMFDSAERLVLTNSRFCSELDDVAPLLRPGLRFHDYVRAVADSEHMALPEGETPESWARSRLAMHGQPRAVFNVSLAGRRWLQISEHRTKSGGTVILQTDVSDIILLERQERERLRDRQAQMVRATLDHLIQGVCIFDGEERLVGWNRRLGELLQLGGDEAELGETFGPLLARLRDRMTFTDGFSAVGLRAWAARRGARPPITFEIRSGALILSAFAQEMPDTGFVISFTDVTAEREAARNLFEMNAQLEARVEERTLELGEALGAAERANASKSRFVAAASHDLLQPLSAAKLFVSALEGRAEGEGVPDIIAKAGSALSDVERIIEALLDISRLDSGNVRFDVKPVALSAILHPLRDQLLPVARDKGIDLSVIDTGLTVDSDAGYLRRIVQNLVSNAVRYTDTGKVLVGVRRNGGSARIEVWDTGPGIPSEHQARIFQEFQRLGATDQQGLGLGLAIVERACKMLDHPLSLWSEPGAGSCFALNVPLSTGTVAAARQAAAAPADGQLAARLFVLLVENDATLARAISLMIEGWGGHVVHAGSGEEALELLSEIQLVPDALLLDHQLGPGRMDGTTFYRAFRSRYGAVPCRVVTAERSRAVRRTCAELDLEMLTKPIDRDRLGAFLAAVRG